MSVDNVSYYEEDENWISRTTNGWIAKVKEINKKYSQPRLKMTPLVKAMLLILRLYLIVLVAILVYKFYTVVSFR